MMKIQFIIVFLLCHFVLVACDERAKNQTENQQATNSKAKKKSKDILLDNQNVRAELLKYAKENPENLIVIKTRFGNMTLKLYEETVLHRANFVRLIKRKYFDNTVFYRVVKDFIVQGGMSDEKNPVPLGKYSIPKEFMPQKYYHKKGALAMARDEDHKNPKKKSSAKDFFIVHGKVHPLGELMGIQQDYGWNFTPEQIQTYTTLGGAPHLDNDYTVFGEVIDGLSIIDSIAQLKVDKMDWPLEDVTIRMEVVEK